MSVVDVVGALMLASSLVALRVAWRLSRRTEADERRRIADKRNGLRRIVSHGRVRRARIYGVIVVMLTLISLVTVLGLGSVGPPLSTVAMFSARTALVVIGALVIVLVIGDAADRERIARYEPAPGTPHRRSED